MENMMQAYVNYFVVDYVGDSEFAIRKIDNQFRVTSRDVLGDTGSHYIDFYIPDSIADDGTEQTLVLVSNPDGSPAQARAVYARYISGGASTYISSSGTLTLSYDWKLARMRGTFEFAFRLAGQLHMVERGSFDITGVSDGLSDKAEFKRVAITAADIESTATASGTFKAFSHWGSFTADEVSRKFKAIPPDNEQYWELVGRMEKDGDLPPLPAQITVFFKEDVGPGVHDLKDNEDVWITYLNRGVIYQASAGTLSIIDHPKDGRATGTLLASFPGDGGDGLVNGEFDIAD
ncbi:hypothetical protein [Pseudomonas sp. EA_5y_Pfl2_R50]|uniref:hypothetical protein n=1 Tax=Pseudomonas sp. EA_5y_Pfl2_R50 TaxID=3088691 RepID=UPI0030DBBBC7